MAREHLLKANKQKYDEYYTRMEDIENELCHYKEHFKGKIVLCNCDDPYESNFFKYFALKFNELGLKKLICTSYDGSPFAYTQISLFDEPISKDDNPKKAYKIEINEVSDFNKDGATDLSDVEWLLKNRKNSLSILKGNGDFRSEECKQILKEADIVVTNPPFSLFREYVDQLFEFNKSFLIMGDPNSVTYKNIFKLIFEGKMWIGYKPSGSDTYFHITEDYKNKLLKEGKEGSAYKTIDGEVLGRTRACWFTNLDIKKRHEDMILYKKYNEEDYPKYDNYDAINVSKVDEIPYDYYGVMGVPISFLDNYSPEQFQLLGLLQSSTEEQAGIPILRTYDDFKEVRRKDMSFTGASGKKANGNPILKGIGSSNGNNKKGNCFYNPNTGEYVHSLYARLTIRRIKNES